MSLSFNTIPDKRLAASILGTDMSFRVSNILGWDGESLVAGDFGTIHYVAFRNSANTALELMEIDPSTIASGSITINKRGLDFNGDLTTEVTANKLLWVKGDTIVSFGTNPPQLYQYLKEYIDGIAIAGSPNASTIAKGLVEEATQAEVRARTAAGGTSARLAVNPSTLPNVLISDYVADTGTADAYLIAPSPAIVAYVTGQVFTFKATNANTTTSTVNVNSLGVKTIKKLGGTDLASGDIGAGMIVQIEYDGTNFQMLNPVGNAPATSADFLSKLRFGGTGADGALSISSGTTTIDCAGASVVVKNYSSISITGTGSLAFSNPASTGTIVIIKCSGNVTITSSATPAIDLRSLGGAAGADAGSGDLSAQASTAGSSNLFTINAPSDSGGGKGYTNGGSSLGFLGNFRSKLVYLATGAGGAGGGRGVAGNYGYGGGGGAGAKTAGTNGGTSIGSGSAGTAGAGGRGAGALYMECAGAYSCSSTINAGGVAGSNFGSGGGAGGGGGGGGTIYILYTTLTSDTGTYTVSGGAGGTGASNNGGAGGDGYSLVASNTEFV